jgi:hypothetical protein
MPPPSVKPATPVDETRPPVVARLCGCVSLSTSAQTAPPPTVARLVHLREIDHDPVVAGREAGDAVAAAADGDQQVVAAGEAHRGRHVAGVGAADDERRAPVVSAVPHLARLCVRSVGRGDDLAVDALSQLLHRRLSKNPRTGDCHDVPFVRGVRGVLSSDALRGLSGHFAS